MCVSISVSSFHSIMKFFPQVFIYPSLLLTGLYTDLSHTHTQAHTHTDAATCVNTKAQS